MWCIYNLYKKYKLKNLNTNDIKFFTLDKKYIYCLCCDVYDSDTVTLILPIHKKYYKMKCRLLGIDGAELRTKDLDEKRIAELGRDFVKETILGKVIKVQCGDWDKYGRLLVVIYHNTKSKKSLNDILIEKNFAYSYDGKKKKTFSEWYNLINN